MSSVKSCIGIEKKSLSTKKIDQPLPHTQFLRIKSRCGAKKAILAVAASMLTATCCMLRDGVEYLDLGVDPLRQA